MGLSKRKQKKISTEELAKTQVLNLEDVQRLAKYEKLISKKPALIVSLIGAFSIIVGASAQTVVSLSKADEPSPMPSINSKISTDNTSVKKDELICTQTTVNEGAEISIKVTYTVDFKDNKIDTYTKTTDVTPTVDSVNSLTSIQNGLVSFKAFESTSVDGYKVVVSSKESGYEVLVTIDPNKLDSTKLSPDITANQFINADISKELTKEQIKANLAGYTCN